MSKRAISIPLKFVSFGLFSSSFQTKVLKYGDHDINTQPFVNSCSNTNGNWHGGALGDGCMDARINWEPQLCISECSISIVWLKTVVQFYVFIKYQCYRLGYLAARPRYLLQEHFVSIERYKYRPVFAITNYLFCMRCMNDNLHRSSYVEWCRLMFFRVWGVIQQYNARLRELIWMYAPFIYSNMGASRSLVSIPHYRFHLRELKRQLAQAHQVPKWQRLYIDASDRKQVIVKYPSGNC